MTKKNRYVVFVFLFSRYFGGNVKFKHIKIAHKTDDIYIFGQNQMVCDIRTKQKNRSNEPRSLRSNREDNIKLYGETITFKRDKYSKFFISGKFIYTEQIKIPNARNPKKQRTGTNSVHIKTNS